MNTRTSTFAAALLFALMVVPAAYGKGPASKPAAKDAGATLKIVKDGLYEHDGFYFVKGSIYNPNANGVKNVVIRYYIWKKFIGHADRGSIVEKGGGLVIARIKYLPPKQTVEFATATDDSAPVYTNAEPDPLNAEINAEWDQDQ
jgi:hypothetical protein